MRSPQVIIAVALGLTFSNTLWAASTTFQGYAFDARVIRANGQQYREFMENKQPTLKVKANEEYSIVVRNPLPVRAAVAVTIDGLNSIDGQRTSPRNAKKWIVAPRSTLTISGWQTSKDTLRKFLFTAQSEAFAQWRENKEGKPFTRNLGVIGVAWFWNSSELDQALHPPQPFVDDSVRSAKCAADAARPAMAPCAKSESRAGTGMGEQQQHAVTEIKFDANAGMFAVKDVLKIFYEFAQDPPEPLPFVDDEEDQGRFTPDMYK